jgi:RHS repeat-associated protein
VSDLTGKYEVIYSSDELLGEEDFIDFGDFNADGNIDLLVHSDTWKSYRYDGVEFIGEGMSQLDGVIGESISVSVNDFDGDGKADILCNLPSPAVPVVEALEKVCKAIINPNYLNSSTNYNGLFNKIRKDVLEVYQNAIDNNLPFAFQLDQDIVSLLREFFLPRAHFSDFSMFIEGSSVKHSPAFNALKLIVISEHQSTFSPTKSWWDKFTAFWGVEKAVYNWGNPHAVRENPSIVIYKSNGADFVPSTYLIEGFQSVQQSMFSDFNGDGMCDVYSSLYLNYIFTPRINLFDNQKLSHFVATVTDGLNNHIEFRYASITGQGGGLLHYSGSSTQLTNPQLSLCTAPLYVVTNLYSITSEQSILSQTSFRYYDALFHKAGKGFLGFRKIGRLHYQASDYGIATLTTNVLDPTYFFLYPLRSETKALTSSGSINSVFDALTTFCQPVSTIEYEFEFDGSYYAVGVIGKHYCFRPKLQLSTDYLTGIASKVEYLNYDGFGNVTEVKNSFQNSGTTTTTTFTYDIFGSWCPNHVLQQSTTFKRTNEYDITRVVNHAYDSKGNLTSIQNFPSLPKSTTVSYQYNLSGLLIEKRIASQGKVRITKQEYDSKNRFVIKEFNALNQKTERTYDSKYGSVLGLTDIDNKTITYVYNGLGRLIQSSDKNDITAIHTKAWEGSTPQQSLYVDYVVRPNEPVSKVWTDNIGRLIKTTVSGIENTTTVTYQYDNRVLTRLKKKSKPFLSTATKFEEYQYDIYNRSITSIDEGRVTNINYGSIPSKETITTFITDPNDLSKNSVSSVKIGNDGYVEERTDNGGVIAYAYYADGQTKSILNNTFTNFTYDDYGRQQTLDDPNAGLTSYEYNGFGELTKQTNPNLNTIVMEYDNAGRVTKKTLNANNPAIAEVTVYNYVPSGNGVNQLLTVSNPNVSQTFTYDNLGRTVSVTENIQNINYTTSFEYNDRGLNTKVTYPSGFSVTKEYDAIGRLYLIKQSDNNQPIWRANQYNNHEMLTQAILGNGMKYNYSYDANNILTGISMQNLSNSIIYNQSYQFDFSTGNLKLRKDLLKLKPGTSIPFQEEFEYDNLNRLFENKVNGVTQTNVTYSPNGNIATKSDVSDDQWQYHHIKTNAVIGISNLKPNIVVPSFNLNIQYNSANRPTYITDNYGTKALTIIYGPDDQRRKTKYVNAGIVVKENIFVGNYEKEVTPNLTKEYHYIQGPNGLVGVYIRSNGTNLGMYYACTDHLGSINALVNSSGVIVEEYSTDPWGKRRNPSDWTTATTSLPVYLSRCFTGHEHLDEFGIINMNARLYDPTIGRMLSPDNYVQSPDNTQSFNRYSYAWNNPVNYTDPSGDFIIEAMLVAGMLNLAANMFNGNVREMVSWKAAGYFAVGAAAGAAGYGVGAGLSSVIGTGGFIGGGVVSGGAGFSSGFAIGTGNNLLNGRSVSESIGGGLQYGLTAAISGFFIGGAIAGTDALLKGRSFWNGQYTRTYLRENGINFTGDAVSESELGEYVANKFANRINQMEYMPDISVNDAEVTKLASSKTAAVTIPSNGNYKLAGASKIYLRSGALSSDKKLFYVLDHELVHATHYSDGSFATWENLFGLQKAIALSEVYAYKSSILMSHKLGLPWTQWSYDLMMQYYGSFTK